MTTHAAGSPVPECGIRRIYRSAAFDAGRAAGARELQWEAVCRLARELGFDSLLIPACAAGRPEGRAGGAEQYALGADGRETMGQALGHLSALCAQHGLSLMVEVAPPPRQAPGSLAEGFARDWASGLGEWSQAGVAGYCFHRPASLPAHAWAQTLSEVRRVQPVSFFMAWTPGLDAAQLRSLAPAGFDAVFSSLPWWDYRAAWLAEEHERLRSVAAVFAPLGDPRGGAPADAAPLRRAWAAAISGDGVLVPDQVHRALGDEATKSMNEWLALRQAGAEPLRILSGGSSPATVLFRNGAGLALNPDDEAPAPLDWSLVQSRLPDSYSLLQRLSDSEGGLLAPGGCERFLARAAPPVRIHAAGIADKRKHGLGLMRAPRIAIEDVRPRVQEGRFAVKCALGQPLRVEADVFMDGHDVIAASLLWRAADETEWREQPMSKLDNDRWRAVWVPLRLGRHYYTIRAWRDEWGSYREQLSKKLAADQDVSLEVEEGRMMLQAAQVRARRGAPELADRLQALLEQLGPPRRGASAGRRRPAPPEGDIPPATPQAVQCLMSDEADKAMRMADPRQHETLAETIYPLAVERREAVFASWYELFPRSQGPAPGVHGSLNDVRRRLPAIRAMGFDVLYFPPIHPIGQRNRKGRNNALSAQPDDPGSPYAIGSAQGGHDAVHPELGTLEDFQALLRAAHRHGLEIALDFAVQCSPDHPWLEQHPEWFAWRADGSLRHAENPPKRYEDIVNPEFYRTAAPPQPQAPLWRELRDVVLFWVEQGVRIFRVDNPHTKPLPFWEWLIGEVQGAHPDTIFLSEAFTRPKMMYRLAKLGFSQSYTYFTWRNHKRELTEYLEELNSEPVAHFFRPNFFVNTPDINPYFLQSSGRPGFLIRAALAATTSGSWGMYSGFELCEAQALPGREEYQDSEKYQLRWRDWEQPGGIVAEISQLNRIRRANPALQSHLGIRFHAVDDDSVLFFSKSTPQQDNIVLVAISLDPHSARSGSIELPLWQWRLPDDASVQMEDLFSGHRFSLAGRRHWVTLAPDRPFFVWRVCLP